MRVLVKKTNDYWNWTRDLFCYEASQATMPSSRPRPKLKYSNRCTQIKTYSWDNAQVILVGNKCDMVTTRSGFETRPYFSLGLFNPFYANLTSFPPSWADRIILSFKKNQYCWTLAICSSPLNWQDKNRKSTGRNSNPWHLDAEECTLPLCCKYCPYWCNFTRMLTGSTALTCMECFCLSFAHISYVSCTLLHLSNGPWMLLLTFFHYLFLNPVIYAFLYGLFNCRTSLYFFPSNTLTHYVVALLRIADNIWPEELGRWTGRRSSPMEQIP